MLGWAKWGNGRGKVHCVFYLVHTWRRVLSAGLKVDKFVPMRLWKVTSLQFKHKDKRVCPSETPSSSNRWLCKYFWTSLGPESVLRMMLHLNLTLSLLISYLCSQITFSKFHTFHLLRCFPAEGRLSHSVSLPREILGRTTAIFSWYTAVRGFRASDRNFLNLWLCWF